MTGEPFGGHPMQGDREAWRSRLHRSNFLNAWRQYEDLAALPSVRKVLVVGPGQGLEVATFRNRGYDVESIDIDSTFAPDRVMSVHDMRAFGDARFDAAVVSHVLEHLPLRLLDTALAEIARVARYALVYLPIGGRRITLDLWLGMRRARLLALSWTEFWKRPTGESPDHGEGNHFWEVGMRGFRVRDVERRLAGHFDVLSRYRHPDWSPSYNFVLRSRRHRTSDS